MSQPDEPQQPQSPVETPQPPASSLFWWDVPRREITWLEPPLPLPDAMPDAVRPEQLLNALGRELPERRLEYWRLLWKYHTRARAATSELIAIDEGLRREQERARSEADARLPDLRRRCTETRAELDGINRETAEARAEFERAAAGAAVVCEPTGPAVDRALVDSAPTLDELAGRHGMGSVSESGNPWTRMFQQILTIPMRFLAPLVSGTILALTMGTLIGLLSIVDLQRADRVRQLGLAALLGFVIVYLLGELVAHGFGSLAWSLERRDESYPAMRGTRGMAIFAMAAAAILAAAEVATEALGIRELHRQYLAEAQRLGDTALDVPLLPVGVYLLIGTLVSGPYLAYKAVSAWNGAEARHREAWLLHLQKEWLDQRRDEPAYRDLLASAARVEKLVRRSGEVEARLKALEEERTTLERGPQVDPSDRVRRDQAREAAVAERKLLDLAIEELIDGPAADQRQAGASWVSAYFSRSPNGASAPRASGGRGQARREPRTTAAHYRRPVPPDDDD